MAELFTSITRLLQYIQYDKYLDQRYINVKKGDMKETQRITSVLLRVSPNRLNHTGTTKTYGAR